MNPSDLPVLIFLVAVPSVFFLFLGLLWSMAHRSRAGMGEYSPVQGYWRGGYPSPLHPESDPTARIHPHDPVVKPEG
jgi:hypothetical protein